MMFLGLSDILPTTIMGRSVYSKPLTSHLPASTSQVTNPFFSHLFSSVAASAFGVVYLAMIISIITNTLAFSPDEQALLGAPLSN